MPEDRGWTLCLTCNGHGSLEMRCATCDGMGLVGDGYRCGACNGAGWTHYVTCFTCRGQRGWPLSSL